MNAIEDVKRDKAYIKYKSIVKNWENEFKSKFSRTPSKFDIKEAPSKIKYAYKKYFQMKSSALEISIYDDDNNEEPNYSTNKNFVHVSDNATFRSSCRSQTQTSSTSRSEDSMPVLPSGPELEHLLLNVQMKNKEPESQFTSTLSQKLFQSSKFCPRNPKKSFTKSQSLWTDKNLFNESTNQGAMNHISKTNHNIVSESSFLETKKSLNTENDVIETVIPNVFEELRGTPLRELNTDWLDRVTGFESPDIKVKDYTVDHAKCEFDMKSPRFGLSNVRVPRTIEKARDYVENSDSEAECNMHNLQPALKKRKLNVKKLSVNNEIVSMNSNNLTKNETKLRQNVIKSEQNHERKTIKINTTKTPTEHPPDVKEYLPFGLEEKINPRHRNPAATLKNAEYSSKLNKTEAKKVDNSGKLEKKISSGTLNDNFVKINIEKKVFVRGKKSVNYSKYKKQQFKDKKALHAGMEFPDAGKISCFKCGGEGHMARFCVAHKGDTLLPLENYTENEIPTLDDMKFSDFEDKTDLPNQSPSFEFVRNIPNDVLKIIEENNKHGAAIQPVYSKYPPEINNEELMIALKKFGHTSFRPGQEEAIKRILCGMSTLLILSTGSGKSLCYQLPAFIYSQTYKCITLVISPLVSLMEDQVLSMPEFLKAACLHTNQTPSQRSKIVQSLINCEINVLLISPEALISGDGISGFAGLLKSLPEIAFACIDEAHCVSQWSHNFRPSYLLLCRVLKEKLNVKCILGLSATASQTTIKSIIKHIGIPDGMNGVITNPRLPDNLCLSVSHEKDKDKALLYFLTSDKMNDCNSIIIYCIRRNECERVAALLRSFLQKPGAIEFEKQTYKKRKRMSYVAEAYHAGMSAYQRKKIQKHFMDGTLRIIVATVAFGMGINKSDIRCIIHFNMPSSFESYVQEVGRAGRDGKFAYCHIFMNDNNNDKNEILRHIHSNTIDRATIRKLLQKVFLPCDCSNLLQNMASTSSESNILRCTGHEVGIPIDSTVEELDLPSENIETLLCYIELHPKQYIKVLNKAYTLCKITSYGGPQSILEATKTCPPLAMAYSIERKRNPDIIKYSVFEFQIIELAAIIGLESGMVKYQLKNLEWVTDGGTSRRSQLKVEFTTLGFRLRAPGDLTPTELDNILNEIHDIVLLQEKAMLYQLEECNSAFSKLGNYSLQNDERCFVENFFVEKSNELKETITNYFQREDTIASDITLVDRPLDEERVKCDVRALIATYKDCNFNGRSIARIFQGISSPNYPAKVWGRCKFWRSHMHEDFYGLMKVATQEIIKMKGF